MAFDKPIEEYFQTKFEERLAVKLPRWDKVYVTPNSLILTKEQELQEIEKNLHEKRIYYQQKKLELVTRWAQLDRKETEFKESVIKFDKFLRENDIKRERAEKKEIEEHDLQFIKDQDIQRLNGEIDGLEKTKAILEHKVGQYKIYEDFLNTVTETSANFSEGREILDRYVVLIITHRLLLDRANAGYELVDQQRAQLAKIMTEKANSTLLYNNKISQLQTKYERAQANVLRREATVNHIKMTAAQKTLLLGQIKVATHNLYMLTCKQSVKAATLDSNNTHGQLMAIEKSLEQLQKILKDSSEMEAQLLSQAVHAGSKKNESATLKGKGH